VLVPALLTGFALAFARALGEYGSVVFISGNMPMQTEITPLFIMTKLEQYDYAGATALAVVMLVVFVRACCSPSICCNRGAADITPLPDAAMGPSPGQPRAAPRAAIGRPPSRPGCAGC
jgi:hypothetical protein